MAHKGLALETTPWRFSDTDAIEISGQGRVPSRCIKVASDPWTIAEYLKNTYQHPSRHASTELIDII
jgi:hypothetical protein